MQQSCEESVEIHNSKNVGEGKGNGIYVSISISGSGTPATSPETDKAGQLPCGRQGDGKLSAIAILNTVENHDGQLKKNCQTNLFAQGKH